MISTLSAILEIAGHPNGKDRRRKLDTLADLRKAIINGHKVLSVIDVDYYNTEPTTIPHYGHDYRCINGCTHDPLPWGVKRYFGIYLVVSGDWDTDDPIRYWINPNAQIVITGKLLPCNDDDQRHELVEVTSL